MFPQLAGTYFLWLPNMRQGIVENWVRFVTFNIFIFAVPDLAFLQTAFAY
jgi:hypothetical protein